MFVSEQLFLVDSWCFLTHSILLGSSQINNLYYTLFLYNPIWWHLDGEMENLALPTYLVVTATIHLLDKQSMLVHRLHPTFTKC